MALISLMVWGCGSDNSLTPDVVASISISPPNATIPIGATEVLQAVPKDQNGNPITGLDISWSSTNQTVATVDQQGTVSAKAEGITQISATSLGERATATISVSSVSVSSVVITPAGDTLAPGASQTFSVITRDAAGNALAGRIVTWTSTNPAVATVGLTGQVNALSAGSAGIIALSEGKSDTSSLLVTGVSISGMHLVFSTYLGGNQQDQIRDIAVDGQGNIYIAGGSESPSFVTTPGAYDQTPNGNYDVFVAKLDPQGHLLWSTVIGGPGYDRAYGIELDPQGFVYIAGRAGSGFPVTPGAFQTTFQGSPDVLPYGPQDGFVCKLKPDGSALVFCSYFGTSDARIIRDLAVNSLGEIFVGSSSESGTLPPAWFQNAYQSSRTGGVDALVAKITTDGSRVVWATYVGGSGDEAEQPSIKVDNSGNVFALYATESADAPTPNGFDHTLGGIRDLYLVKLSSDGRQLLFGTYLGGSGPEGVETHEMTLDPQGNPVVGNTTGSPDFPTTSGAFQRIPGGGSDAFITKVSADGSHIIASTLLGGPLNEGSEGVSIDAAGNIYVTGGADSPTLPFLSSGVQGILGGIQDMMVVKLSPDLTRVLYGTYLGGGDLDAGRAAAVTPGGDFIFGGTTNSLDFPTLGPIQSFYGGGLDAVVAKLSPGP
ncbi:MAG: Ig-like domain-containing protein [Gemmatimonadota bacterium]